MLYTLTEEQQKATLRALLYLAMDRMIHAKRDIINGIPNGYFDRFYTDPEDPIDKIAEDGNLLNENERVITCIQNIAVKVKELLINEDTEITFNTEEDYIINEGLIQYLSCIETFIGDEENEIDLTAPTFGFVFLIYEQLHKAWLIYPSLLEYRSWDFWDAECQIINSLLKDKFFYKGED